MLSMLWRYAETGPSWYAGREKYFENPPPDKLAATSGFTRTVPPTAVTKGPGPPYRVNRMYMSSEGNSHDAGKMGMNCVLSIVPLFERQAPPPTPKSPLAKRTLTPLAPS